MNFSVCVATQISDLDRIVTCVRCKRYTVSKAIYAFLGTPCVSAPRSSLASDQCVPRRLSVAIAARGEGQSIHPSHGLQELNGVYWCIRCGCYARVAAVQGRVVALAKQCPGLPTSNAAAAAIRLFKNGQPPHGRFKWPSGNDSGCFAQ